MIKKMSYITALLIIAGLLTIVYPIISFSQDGRVVMAPMLIDQTYYDASQRLRSLGLKALRIAPPEDCAQERMLNRVLSQRPEAGTLLKPGSSVTLVTCQPALINKTRQVPNLNGMELAEAKMLLQKLDLKLRVIYKNDCFEAFSQNKIVDQQPAAMSMVKRGALVWVRICRYKH